mmetsp:Transcript_65243/g.180970  ORF Transcript_65243/g.180970 Transcript_65243/m.180970 type:complete len:571 (+) Transcript_65243:59-1771(+)
MSSDVPEVDDVCTGDPRNRAGDPASGAIDKSDSAGNPRTEVRAELEALLQQHHGQLVRHLDEALDRRQSEVLERLAALLEPLPAAAAAARPGQSPPLPAPVACRLDGSRSLSTSQGFATERLPRPRKGASFTRSFSETLEHKRSQASQQNVWKAVKAFTSERIEEQDQQRWRMKVARLVNSGTFESLCCFLIVSNAIFFGIEAQYMAELQLADPPEFLEVVGVVYTLWFVLELILRVVPSFSDFLCSEQRVWNVVDSCIVIVSLVELTMRIWQINFQGGQNFTYIRLIRTARTVRIFRIIRILKVFTSLRILLYSVMNTLRSLIWTMVLLGGILYVFGLLFTQAVTEHMVEFGEVPGISRYYGNLPRSVYTLFKAVTGGVDWQEVAVPLGIVSPMWEIVFVIFIAFTQFAVLNVVTGTFCQSAIESANHDKDVMVQAQMASKQRYTEQLQELFETLDPTNSGRITPSTFEESLNDRQVQAYFHSLEITVDDAWNLFRLLDDNESNSIDLEEFVTGCLRLRGSARSIDIHMLMYESKWTMRKLSEVLGVFNGLVDSLRAAQSTSYQHEVSI